MKTTLQFFFLMLIAFFTNAQSSVNLQINHYLNGERFENEVSTTNDLGNDFMVDRLEYYLSGFSIIHDGGLVTEVEDLYVLVSLLESSDATIIELGEYAINNLEAVRFHFGVDQEANHADPALWHPSHALAPKFPSMHWGWAAGYRFIALEGKSGPSLDQELQFHCIGDEFYSELEFEVSMNDQSEYVIVLDAEYTNLLKGIDVTSGLIIHGGTGEVIDLAENITNNVFAISGVTSTKDSELVKVFDAFPNPVTNQMLTIQTEVASINNKLQIFDALGRIIYTGQQSNSAQIEISNKGMYYISIIDSYGSVLATRKVVVQ